jgi:hypothetical protein
MTREVTVAKEHRCERCGKVFANLMRLQHHIAAEHALRTSRDIRTTRDIPHSTGNSNALGRADVLRGLQAKT